MIKLSPKWRASKVACLRSRLHWLHCEALCAEPLVLPSLPDQYFLHGMILLSWRPKNWKIKKRRCLHGRSERERERSTACMSVDWLTDTRAWRCVCSRLLTCLDCDIVELAVSFLCHATVSFIVFCSYHRVQLCDPAPVTSPVPRFCTCCIEWTSCTPSPACTRPPVVKLYVMCRVVCRWSVIYCVGFMTRLQENNHIPFQ